jgi:hypothetical protein
LSGIPCGFTPIPCARNHTGGDRRQRAMLVGAISNALDLRMLVSEGTVI